MKRTAILWIALLVVAQPAMAVLRNVGPQVPAVFHGHSLTPVSPATAVRVLYAPSEADDPAYRSLIVAALPAGSVVDYYDARNGTPDASLLATYNAVHVWANYAFLSPEQFGDRLADYVDQGGTVVLGAFCTYCMGNDLRGRIMTPEYCPVSSPTCSNHFATDSWSGDDASQCDYYGVTGWSAMYRDYLTLQSGGFRWGTFRDGEIADAVTWTQSVHYVNGSGGSPILVDNAIAAVVANASYCRDIGVPTVETTWGMVKALYR